MNEENKQTALTIIELETHLQQVSEQVKAQIDFYNKTKNTIEELKQKLKNETSGKVKETISLGDNTLDISIHNSSRVAVADPEKVAEEFLTKVPNTKLASSYYKAGMDLPDGFEVKQSRSITIKFNGETL